MIRTFLAGIALTIPLFAFAAERDEIHIVGSSTVYPFTTLVAEQFQNDTGNPMPVIESTGTGGGMILFCGGVGAEYPDATNASRRMRPGELELCQSNGINKVVEIQIGYDGIVLAGSTSSPQMDLSLREIYLALARFVPNKDGTSLIENPYTLWSEINPRLPQRPIEVLGPPPSSGTRDAFVELIMHPGADSIALIKDLTNRSSGMELRQFMEQIGIDPEIYDLLNQRRGKAPDGADIAELLAGSMRQDGPFIEAGENDFLMIRKLVAHPGAMGILGYSFLGQNADLIQAHSIESVSPGFDTIANSSYRASRPLFVYIKADHVDDVVPGIREFLQEYVSEEAWGASGYLSGRGLIPLSPAERQSSASTAINLHSVQL